MKREIKFRARDFNGRWCYFPPSSGAKGHKFWKAIEDRELNPETLGQSTGIKNRKGQEIFEGDILKFDYGDNHGVGKVIFAMQGFYIESKHGALFQDTVPTMEHSEVIGNIHETPELLK